MKMALQYWQHTQQAKRIRFAAFADAYHGDTLGAVSLGGIDLFHATFKPLLFDVIRVKDMAGLRRVADETLAAVVIEPLIQGAGGMKLWPGGLLKELREFCTQNGALLIVDEVMTGFGRTGKMFACEHEGVTPDLMAVAKGLTGGYLRRWRRQRRPRRYSAHFSATMVSSRRSFTGTVTTGNQLGCAAALANLRVFEEERTLEKLKRTG